MGLLLLFFDGIGVGRDDPAENPFAEIDPGWLAPVAGRAPVDGTGFKGLDATLGVAGLPQSATGQTTLLTGVNAAKHIGHHQVGTPGPSLRPLLATESIFLKLTRAGARPTFANAFSRQHLEAPRPRWSASTRAYLASGLPFRMWDAEGKNDTAVSHDYTGDWMTARGFPMPLRTAEQAAEILCGLVDGHDFVLYEYFLTDLAGHRGTHDEQVEHARRTVELVNAVVSRLDLDRHDLLMTSDHGNLEEATHKRHTLNPVPLLTWGSRSEELLARIDAMTDVTPAIVAMSGSGSETS
jgi:hypothetical protein